MAVLDAALEHDDMRAFGAPLFCQFDPSVSLATNSGWARLTVPEPVPSTARPIDRPLPLPPPPPIACQMCTALNPAHEEVCVACGLALNLPPELFAAAAGSSSAASTASASATSASAVAAAAAATATAAAAAPALQRTGSLEVEAAIASAPAPPTATATATATAAPPHSRQPWVCVCTYENEAVASRCLMCDSLSPALALKPKPTASL
jgi:hypothetical protein